MISAGKPEELEEILALTRACGKHMRENGIEQWDENYPDPDSLKQDLKTGTLFAFREDGQILGIVVLNESQDEEYSQINWLTGKQDKSLVVHRLAVRPDQQEKGIARKIMDFAEEFARENAYDSIRLDTFSQNPRNQKFYRNRDYQELGSVFLKYRNDYPYFCYELLLNS